MPRLAITLCFTKMYYKTLNLYVRLILLSLSTAFFLINLVSLFVLLLFS